MNSSLDDLRQAALVNGLRQCALFAEIPNPALREIAALTSVRRLETGHHLFHEHTQAPGVFIVQQGAIKLHRITALRHESVIHVFRPYESLGEETLVAQAGCLASASATEPSQVLMVQKAGFIELLRRDPELSLSVLRALDRQLSRLVARIDDLTLKDVPTRVVEWLLQHCPDPDSPSPQTVHVMETKRLLAAELGTCSETLCRTLARLRDQRLLSVQGRAVKLHCPRRLAELFQGGRCAPSPLACRPGLGRNHSVGVPAFA